MSPWTKATGETTHEILMDAGNHREVKLEQVNMIPSLCQEVVGMSEEKSVSLPPEYGHSKRGVGLDLTLPILKPLPSCCVQV